MQMVYIILVNYNSYKDTIECAKSLEKIEYKNFKIIIVDNGSKDESLSKIRRELKECILIETGENLGFAGGNNAGINYAIKNGADYVLLLNNDTLVKSDFLNKMLLRYQQNDNIGLVGCKIMYYPEKNRIWFGGGKIDWFKFIGTHFGIGEVDNGQYDQENEIDFMTGCCMLIKREVIEKVGLLSEQYFMYFEDVDFCVKVKEAGYKIWYNPKAVIYHKVGLSGGGEESPFSIKWSTRNRMIFMNKYKYKISTSKLILSKVFYYVTRFVRFFQYLLSFKMDKAKAIIEGMRS